MRCFYFLALVAGLGGVAAAAYADEKADEKALHELAGTYVLIGLEGKGLKITEEMLKDVDASERTIKIQGREIIAVTKGKDDPAKFTIDPSKNPRHITITSTKNGRTETNYGIYEFKDGILTICATDMGAEKDRPTKFEASDNVLIIRLKKQVK
ncbi:MAG: TIGR03067 domain-containing protein [Gemmataceae bacterium]|nr:TIGR03067 domain-containing protein [Gemmata sp.]MDW8196865.1 TIGR03067 domain-containing protein [Gemmataceae bacterium]